MATERDETAPLSSERHEAASEIEAIEQLMEAGHTDGLPVIPPTPERVEAMLGTVGVDPDEILGTVPARHRIVRAEKAAANAVMAGCEPAVFPVVVAVLRAVCDPRFSIHGPSASTAGPAVLIVVNGPIVDELDFNAGSHLFGPGSRANATVGRALNLTLRNTIGAREEEFDRAAFSHAGRYSFCIAENQSESPWTPFHVQRGFEPDDSTVTVYAADAPAQVANNDGKTAEAVLSTIAGRMAAPGVMGIGFDSEIVVVIGREHTGTIAEDGWDKTDVQEFLADNATMTLADLKECGMVPEPVEEGDEEVEMPLVNDPEHVFVIAAGGPAGPFSAVVPGWTGRDNSRAVTTGIPGWAREAACELPDLTEEAS